jgi:hypothetical protein
VNDRFEVHDPAFAEMLWRNTGLKECVEAYGPDEEGKSAKEVWGGEVVGLSPRIRIYRYLKGQFFDKHCECP